MADDRQPLHDYFAHLASAVTSPWGRELVNHLRARFLERRAWVTEQTPEGRSYQRLARVNVVAVEPLALAKQEGVREVIAYLEDLQDLEVRGGV